MKVEIVQPMAYLDVSIGNEACGRIVVELYQDKAPLATSNFLKLLLKLPGTYFHRVIKNFMIQGGDVEYGKSSSFNDERVGTGRAVAEFADENLTEKLDGPFKLCMANSGPNTNSSQFFITTYPAPHLDGKHTVFGRVIHGKSVVRAIEKVQTTKSNVPVESSLPVITSAGEWNEGDQVPIFNACYDPIGGDIYEEHPDDDEHIDKESSLSVFEAASIIKNSGGELFKKGQLREASLKYKKSLRYVMEYLPDEDLEPELYTKYVELKKKLYLNLSLVCLKVGDLAKCVDYCTYLLDMELLPGEKGKTLYRMGSAHVALKKYGEAVKYLQSAKEVVSDAGIEKELKRAEELMDAEKKKERAKYAKFFG
ncbi:CIC11C00000002102 [Sungouiella intermedia]|uniref:peptidylprolyl isomerase n=1 Tax=Sungouiella intermedia TaxID=45354 RepID=A0A1L0BTS3_9ASCO|nr:CIC11C00000002102 [[Candida] intermedia]